MQRQALRKDAIQKGWATVTLIEERAEWHTRSCNQEQGTKYDGVNPQGCDSNAVSLTTLEEEIRERETLCHQLLYPV